MTNLPQPIEYSKQRILTTKQIAELYGTDNKTVAKNFERNRTRYVLGKHYYALEGQEKNTFLNQHQIDDGSKKAKTLYLWTEKGALNHAKSLGTDEAWDMYERLVDDYYRLKEQEKQSSQSGFLNNLWVARAQLFHKQTKIAADKFCVFRETTTDFFEIEMKGCGLPEKALPDGSIGRRWCTYAREVLLFDMSLVTEYEHHYPDKRGVQPAYLYPIEWLPAFRKWFKEVYIPLHLPEYLNYLKLPQEEIQKIMSGFGVSYQMKRMKKGK